MVLRGGGRSPHVASNHHQLTPEEVAKIERLIAEHAAGALSGRSVDEERGAAVLAEFVAVKGIDVAIQQGMKGPPMPSAGVPGLRTIDEEHARIVAELYRLGWRDQSAWFDRGSSCAEIVDWLRDDAEEHEAARWRDDDVAIVAALEALARCIVAAGKGGAS
jgi:hypothetical protein